MRSNVLANSSGVISRLCPTEVGKLESWIVGGLRGLPALSNSSTLQLSNSSFELRQPLKVLEHEGPVLRRNVRTLQGAVHPRHQRGGHCLWLRPWASGPSGADNF